MWRATLVSSATFPKFKKMKFPVRHLVAERVRHSHRKPPRQGRKRGVGQASGDARRRRRRHGDRTGPCRRLRLCTTESRKHAEMRTFSATALSAAMPLFTYEEPICLTRPLCTVGLARPQYTTQ